MRKFITILICVTVAACKLSPRKIEKSYFQAGNATIYENKAQLNYINALELNADSMTTSALTGLDIFADTVSKKSYLGFLSPITRNIIVYDYDTRNVVKKIPLYSKGKNNSGPIVNPSMFKLMGIDTVLYFNFDHLFVLGSDGIKHKSIPFAPNSKRTQPKPNPGTYAPIVSAKNKAYLLCGYNSWAENQTELHDLLKVDLLKGTKQELLNRSPVYSQSYWGYNENLYALYGVYNKNTDQIVLSYPADPFLYSYKLSSGKIKKEAFAGSKFFRELKPYLEDTDDRKTKPSEEDMKASAEHEIINPSYFALLYDEVNNIYIRVAYLPRTKQEYNNPLTRYKFRCTFILLDENFKKIGEQIISDAMTTDYRLMFIKDGYLHLFNKAKYNANNRKLFFDKYKIEYKR